ncbi:dTMP kinase [Lagierella sp.]|uniref:dTMP kinase n=1 Tax=Lagierella sp. TaxID=2849657 RepID=UPI00261BE0CE|nr:dTMP kinase [Lagierella sp.]
MFITFEGPDGCGKSTVLAKVYDRLREKKIPVIKTREPGGTEISEKLRDIILDVNNVSLTDTTESLLYAASRSQHVEELIVPNLEKGNMVLCDRFVISSLVYQGYARDLGVEKIEELNLFATQGVKPDIVLFFEVSEENLFKRKKNRNTTDRLEEEEEFFHKKVFKGYNYIKERYKSEDNFFIIDGNRSIEEVVSDCFSVILKSYRRKI